MTLTAVSVTRDLLVMTVKSVSLFTFGNYKWVMATHMYCNMLDLDPCGHLLPCENGGICVNNATSLGGYTCSCLRGYGGDKCELGKLMNCCTSIQHKEGTPDARVIIN